VSVADRSPLVDALAAIVGRERCLSRPEELYVYECDALTLHRARPAAVVLPRDTAEVARIVRACRRFGVPFVPRGAGTGLSGGALALDGGVVIECARMDRILALDPLERLAVVEALASRAREQQQRRQKASAGAHDKSERSSCNGPARPRLHRRGQPLPDDEPDEPDDPDESEEPEEPVSVPAAVDPESVESDSDPVDVDVDVDVAAEVDVDESPEPLDVNSGGSPGSKSRFDPRSR